MIEKQKILVCLDFGNVIMSQSGVRDLTIPPTHGSFEQIKLIIKKIGAEHVHIVSKCSEDAESFIKDWLKWHSFYSKTGFKYPRDNIHFCRERTQKAEIVKSILHRYGKGYDTFVMVDDRWSVMKNFDFWQVGLQRYLILLNPTEDERSAWERALASSDPFVAKQVMHVENWPDTANIFKNLLRGA